MFIFANCFYLQDFQPTTAKASYNEAGKQVFKFLGYIVYRIIIFNYFIISNQPNIIYFSYRPNK